MKKKTKPRKRASAKARTTTYTSPPTKEQVALAQWCLMQGGLLSKAMRAKAERCIEDSMRRASQSYTTTTGGALTIAGGAGHVGNWHNFREVARADF